MNPPTYRGDGDDDSAAVRRRWFRYWLAVGAGTVAAYSLIALASSLRWWCGTIVSFVYLSALLVDARASSMDWKGAQIKIKNDVESVVAWCRRVICGRASPENESIEVRGRSSRLSDASNKPLVVRSALFSSEVWFAFIVCALTLPGLTATFGRGHPYRRRESGQDLYLDSFSSEKGTAVWRTNWSSLPPQIEEKWKNPSRFSGSWLFPRHTKVGSDVYLVGYSSPSSYQKVLLTVNSTLDFEQVRFDILKRYSVKWVFAASNDSLCGSIGIYGRRKNDKEGSVMFCGDRNKGFKQLDVEWEANTVRDVLSIGDGLLWLSVSAYAPGEGLSYRDKHHNQGSAILSLEPDTMELTLHSTLEKIDPGGPGLYFLFFSCPVFLVSLLVWYLADVKSTIFGFALGTGLGVVFSSLKWYGVPSVIGNIRFIVFPAWVLVQGVVYLVRPVTPSRREKCAWSIAIPVLALLFSCLYTIWRTWNNVRFFPDDEITWSIFIICLRDLFLIAVGLALDFDLVMLAGSIPLAVETFSLAVLRAVSVLFLVVEVGILVLIFLLRFRIRALGKAVVSKCVAFAVARLPEDPEMESLLEPLNDEGDAY